MAVKPRFWYMPDDASASDWREEVHKQLRLAAAAVRDGIDVGYASELLRESVDRYLIALCAETPPAT